MIVPRRYYSTFLAISITALFTLTACGPKADDTDTTQTGTIPAQEDIVPASADETEKTENTDTLDPHAGHDMQANASGAEEVEMSDMLKDYTKSMSSMHDEMMIGMGYNDPDTAFAKGMLGHHRGAIDMAKIELKYGTNNEMRTLAQDIITAQQGEIDIMRKWLASHPDAAKPKPNTEAMQKAYAEGMDVMQGTMMAGIADPIPDMAFARGMLSHHMAAVDMALTQLKYGTDEEMRTLALQVIDTQQLEIQFMESWIAMNAAESEPIENNTTEDSTADNSSTEGDVEARQPAA